MIDMSIGFSMKLGFLSSTSVKGSNGVFLVEDSADVVACAFVTEDVVVVSLGVEVDVSVDGAITGVGDMLFDVEGTTTLGGSVAEPVSVVAAAVVVAEVVDGVGSTATDVADDVVAIGTTTGASVVVVVASVDVNDWTVVVAV